MSRLLSVAPVLAVGVAFIAPQCAGGGTVRADCYDTGVSHSRNGYHVRDVACVNGPGTVAILWECRRDGAVVSKPMATHKWQTSATFGAACWNAVPRITSITP